MRIKSIKIRNFRCYYGSHPEVSLGTTPTAHVILVYGENMRGKTSLLQAIRWCLYECAADRQGDKIPFVDPVGKEQLLNMDAESEEDCTLEVELRFEHDGRDYILRRCAEAEGTPRDDSDFSVSKYLSTDTEQFSESTVDARIQNMLSEDISRFFLFDAEMLEEYEDLLKNPEQEAAAVKQSIEKILGVPALCLFSALAEEAETAESKSNAHIKKRDKHDVLVEEAAQLANSIRSLGRDIADLGMDRSRLQQKVNEAEVAVSRNTEIEVKIRETGVWEQQVQEEKDRLDAATASIADLLQQVWWLPVIEDMQERLTTVRDERNRALTSLRNVFRMEQLEESSERRRCVTCDSELDRKQWEAIKVECTQLKLENYGIDFDSLVEAAKRAELYEQFGAGDALAEIRLHEKSIAEATANIAEIETRIDELRASMSDRARGDWQAKLDKFRMLEGQLKDLDERIDEQNRALIEVKQEHEKKQRQLNRLPDADPALALEASAYRALGELFEGAVDVFRDGLREKVGNAASSIFRELTTEADYEGLRIDENYGLALLDGQGRAVPGRSAGAEQIVALSLIGGLNASAVREGPVVMDSNFARLDIGHRENVIRFLPHLGDQVIVLVHSGEIEKERDLGRLGVNVARKYEVARVTDTKSELREL